MDKDKFMARYNENKLPYSKQEELLDIICEVLSYLKTKEAIRKFLKDLLNRQERIMLVRRLLIAELLFKGKSYREIQNKLHAGLATIGRVNRWLNFGRRGYKIAIAVKNKEK